MTLHRSRARVLPAAELSACRAAAVRLLREFAEWGGGADRECPGNWLAVGPAIGCRVHTFHAPGGERGEYAPCLDGTGRGVVAVNTAVSPPTQARILVHEYAHHLLDAQVTYCLFADEAPSRYDGDPLALAHRMARAVEGIVFGGGAG